MYLNTIKFLASSLLLLIFFSPHDAFAQRGLRCGQICDPARPTCITNSYCHPTLKVCYENGCDPNLGRPACCRSNKPARPAPTTVPTGVTKPGNPVVPTTATTPGSTDPGTNITPGAGILTPAVTGAPRGGSAGDCSGPVEGTKDGKVDLADFNLLRKEFSGSATTLFCDNDTNGVVDLLDFNIFRIAFIAQK